MMQITDNPLHTFEDLLRECYGDQPVPPIADTLLDLPAIAAAFGRRLREAGLPVGPAHAELYARSLDLSRPSSHGALYWTTRAVFVTSPSHVPAFDRVFSDIFQVAAA